MLSVSSLTKFRGETFIQMLIFKLIQGKSRLVSLNGTGKTTLFRMITGEEKLDQGQISIQEQNEAYFSQNVGEMKGQTAIQVVLSGDVEVKKMQEQLTEFEEKLCDPDLDPDEMNNILMKMGDVQTEFEKRGGYDLEQRAEEVLTGLGIAPSLHQNMMETFSGGKKMRIALARVLVINPDLIIMDEPTNYLDMETILWLEEWLQNFPGAILMTTHDRYFMNNVCNKIIEIAHRRVSVYSGNFDFYEQESKVRLEQIKAEARRQAESIAKDEEFIERFKARASHAAQVQSRVKKLEKIERIEIPPEEETIDLNSPNLQEVEMMLLS